MNPDEARPGESVESPPELFGEEEPFLMRDVPSPGGGNPPRRSSGGLFAVLGLLVPVVLGGVTVFGVYFLFVGNWRDNASRSAPNADDAPQAKPEAAPRSSVAETPPQAPFLSGEETPLANPPEPAAEPDQLSSADREAVAKAKQQQAAAGKLRLAKKLLDRNPSAAVNWFRDVARAFPGTPAAQEAQAWLKEHGHQP